MEENVNKFLLSKKSSNKSNNQTSSNNENKGKFKIKQCNLVF